VRCRGFHRLLSSYLDGELKPAQDAAAQAHLRGCPKCRRAVNDLRLLVSEAEKLASATLTSDLWPAIQRRTLTQPEVSVTTRPRAVPLGGWRPKIAWAMTIAVVFTTLFLLRQHVRSPRPIAHSPEGKTPIITTAKADIDLAKTHYQNSISSLEQIVAHRAHEMDPERALLYQEKLVKLEEAIDECSLALDSNSYNIRAQRALFDAYDNKISTLREMAVSAAY